MITTRDLITQAYEDGEDRTGDAVTNEEAARGLRKLNQMMHDLKGQGADTGWVDVTLNDDVPLGPEHIRAVSNMLAQEVRSPDLPISPTILGKATAGRQTLQAAFVEIPKLEMDPAWRDRLRDYSASDIDNG